MLPRTVTGRKGFRGCHGAQRLGARTGCDRPGNVAAVTDTPAVPPPTLEPPNSPPAAHPPGDGAAPDVPEATDRLNGDRETAIDLDAIERDLAATETALTRLDDGSYWRDEVTGDDIPDHVLAADPLARRAAP